MLPLVSVSLTVACAMRGLTIPEVAMISSVEPIDVENSGEEVHPVVVIQMVAVSHAT